MTEWVPAAPRIATHDTWPPNYVEVFAWRQRKLRQFKQNPKMLAGAIEYYRTRPVEFINHWLDTYDPRNAGKEGKIARMPFILFKRQAEFVTFLHQLIEGEEDGLIEKCRDAGATWVACAFSVWLWRFYPGASVGWGSRKEALVDKLGDPDSIFEKIRMIIDKMPKVFWPDGFVPKQHATFMKVINPDSQATIVGEAGDNIGRGGRSLIYFKDEAAHYERPELIEAALGDNTRVQVDISSVNGLGNVFHRRREGGVDWEGSVTPARTNVFVFDWRHHPAKTQDWYDRRRQKAIDDGLQHVFAQEVDRDYASAVENVLIPAAWVSSAIDAHIRLGWQKARGRVVAGQDVADEGGDKNANVARRSYLMLHADDWSQCTTGQTTERAIGLLKMYPGAVLNYDSIGVGAGVRSDAARIKPPGLTFEPWNAGGRIINPDDHVDPDDSNTPVNKDFYLNLKAQAGWSLRRRFERTHRWVTEGVVYDVDDCISIPSNLPKLSQLQKELSQPTYAHNNGGKLLINKKPEGTKSPNLFDGAVMAYSPMETGLFGIL